MYTSCLVKWLGESFSECVRMKEWIFQEFRYFELIVLVIQGFSLVVFKVYILGLIFTGKLRLVRSFR